MPVVRVTVCAGGVWLLFGMFDVLRNDRLPVKELP